MWGRLWSLLKVGLDTPLLAVSVALALTCGVLAHQRNAALTRAAEVSAAFSNLAAVSERLARSAIEVLRMTEANANQANEGINHDAQTAAAAAPAARAAVLDRLRHVATRAQPVADPASAATAPAGAGIRLVVPPAAGLSDLARSDLVDLAASANTTARALGTCQRYVREVVQPAMARLGQLDPTRLDD